MDNRWTKETALERISKSGYKGLSYWSAYDYLFKHYQSELLSVINGIH